MDRDALSSSQQEALSQLQALTNGGDTEVTIGVLESVGWDVQVSHHCLALPLGFCHLVFAGWNHEKLYGCNGTPGYIHISYGRMGQWNSVLCIKDKRCIAYSLSCLRPWLALVVISDDDTHPFPSALQM